MLVHVLDALNRFIFMFSLSLIFRNPFGIYSDIIEFRSSFLALARALAASIRISISCVNEFQLTHVLFIATFLWKNTHNHFILALFRWPFNPIEYPIVYFQIHLSKSYSQSPIKQSAAFYCCIFPFQSPFLFPSFYRSCDGFTTSN